MGCWPCSARPTITAITRSGRSPPRSTSPPPCSDHYDGRIEVGIGVNSGPVVAGTVGGGGRVEFTVIGDAVNTASRVEAATRETGDDVLITEATRELLPGAVFDLHERSSVPLKGKHMEVRLWAPKARHQRPSAIRAARGRAGAASVAD